MAERFEAPAISRNRIFAALWMLCGLAEGLAASGSAAILAARVQLDYSPQSHLRFALDALRIG